MPTPGPSIGRLTAPSRLVPPDERSLVMIVKSLSVYGVEITEDTITLWGVIVRAWPTVQEGARPVPPLRRNR